MNGLQAIVFDLDDTLFSERDFVLSGFRAVAEWAGPRLGLTPGDGFDELHALFSAGVRGDTFARWLASHGLRNAPLERQLVDVYRSHQPRIAPRPGVVEILNELGSRFLLGLVTDGPVSVQRSKLGALEIGAHFDAVVFSDELGGKAARKPNPLPFLTVLARLEVEGPKAVYVADNPTKDFLGARRAGMLSIRFRAGDGIYDELEPAGPKHAPDAELDSLSRLDATLSCMLATRVDRATTT